MVFFFI